MPEILIGDQLVGDGHPTYMIAEIGVNHNGFLGLAFELIDAAVDAGADAVKFQKRTLDKLYGKKYLEDSNAGEKNLRYMLPILQRVELSDQDYFKIVEYCKNAGITFMCSAFDSESADFLDQLGVPAYKVASADLTNLPLLDHLITKNKPLILSTGMSRMEEVEITVQFLKDRNAEFALLHCNSTYPAAFEDINLRFMDALRKFDVPVGYSGHERGISVSTVAAALGATIIERHLTLDRTMDGPDHAASLEPYGFKKMVRDVRQVSQALGTGEEKYISMGEILNREVLAKSLVANRKITAGEKITAEMISVKGPALGLSPQNYPDLIGQTAIRDIEEDEPFLERDLGRSIQIDDDQILPIDYGFVVRFLDFKQMLGENTSLVEFHFTDGDLDEEYPGDNFTESDDRPLQLVVHAPEFWERNLVNLCSSNEQDRVASRELMQRSIDFTRSMAKHFVGVPKVIVHPGAMSLDQYIVDREKLYDNLRRSVEELDFEGVEFLLENLPPRPWYFGGQWLTNAFMDAYEIKDFITSMNLNMCFDTSHSKLYCNWAHVDLYDQLKTLLPYIRHLHLADAAGLDGEGMQIGEGNIDWVKLFQTLGDFQNSMVPEIWRGHQREGEGFKIAIQRLSVAYYEALGESLSQSIS